MSDEELFILVQSNDEHAFKLIFTKYYAALREYASFFVYDEDAEEVVQDIMVRFWELRNTLYIESSLRGYLFKTVKNRCLNLIKSEQLHQRVHSEIQETLKQQLEDPDFYLFDELSKRIDEAVEGLPPSYKEAFLLSRFGELTYQQVAEQLNVSTKTIEYRISQSLKLLRAKLKGYLSLISLFISIYASQR